MKKYFLLGMCFVLATFTLLGGAGCSRVQTTLSPLSNSPIGPVSTPIPSNAAVYTPPQATDMLGCGLYNFYQNQSGNIFFSPFSIITCLAMAQEGAVGNTQVQMQNVLNLNPNTTTRLTGFQSLINEINAPGKSYTLDTADNMWLQVGFPFQQAYINTVQTYYDAGVTNVDFVNNPTAALQTINGAVSQETAGFIPDLFSSLPSNTKLVLTNAIYFKGDWQYQFPVTNTNQQIFNLTTSTTEPVSMMHITFNANVGSFNGAASVLAIPYTNGESSMYVFLPPEGGMPALEGAMTGNNINSWLAANSALMTSATAVSRVDLALPKFTFKTSYDLSNTLSSMGMSLAFTPPGPTTMMGANFWNIDGTNNLYITDVVHQAYVDVSEKGTTAAAATGVVIGCNNCQAVFIPPPPIPFVADHPFIFMIVDNASNTVLFMGRVNDPLSGS